MIYRGPDFLAVVRFGSSPTLPPPTLLSAKLSLFLSPPVRHQAILLTGEGGRDGGGAESYCREKAWSSINHQFILSVPCFRGSPFLDEEGRAQVTFTMPGSIPVSFATNAAVSMLALCVLSKESWEKILDRLFSPVSGHKFESSQTQIFGWFSILVFLFYKMPFEFSCFADFLYGF